MPDWLSRFGDYAMKGLGAAKDAGFDALQSVSDAASGARYLLAPNESEQAGDLAQGSLKAGFHEAVKQSPVLKGLKSAASTVGGALEGAGYLAGTPTDLQKIGLAEQGQSVGTGGAFPMEALRARSDPRGLAPASIPSRVAGQPTFADQLAYELNSRPIPKDAGQLADEAANRGDTAANLYHSYVGGVARPVVDVLAGMAGMGEHGLEAPDIGGSSKAISLLGVGGDLPEMRKLARAAMTTKNADELRRLEGFGDIDDAGRRAWSRAQALYPRLTAHHSPTVDYAAIRGGLTEGDTAGQFQRAFSGEKVGGFGGTFAGQSGRIYLKPGLSEDDAFDTIIHELKHGARNLRQYNQGGIYKTLPPPGAVGDAADAFNPRLRPSVDWGAQYDLTMNDLQRDFMRRGLDPDAAERAAYAAHPEEHVAESQVAQSRQREAKKAARKARTTDDAAFEDALKGLESALGAGGLELR